jgi:hypothetical protein
MVKIKTNKVLRANLLAHSSVKAWIRLQPGCVEPNRIVILRESKTSNASVYRLDGVGLRGSAVIAKFNKTEFASIERTVYEEVLPHLPIPSLHYYGYVEEDSQFGWLFLECAHGEVYSSCNEEHRALAARWVGLLHTSTPLIPLSARLPDRGPKHYLDHLRSACNTIQRNLGNPALCNDDLEVLKSIILQCDILEQRWSQMENFCDGMPRTFTHGDLKEKNVHFRSDQQRKVLIAFDWETAGWGVPAIDLRKVDLIDYWRTVRNQWLDMDFQTIQGLANFGKICWCLAAINWQSLSLAHEWIGKSMERMRLYQARLSEAIQAFEDAN